MFALSRLLIFGFGFPLTSLPAVLRTRIHQSDEWIRIWLWIRIFLSPIKNSKKNLDSYCFVTSFRLFIFENDVNVPSKSNKQKNFFKKYSFVSILKVNDENSRIRIRIHQSEASSADPAPDPDPHQNVMDPQHRLPVLNHQNTAVSLAF